MTGKFPLAEPFRETGMMLPATLPPDWTGRVLDTTTMALRALGVVCGVTQTELKLTTAGPRVIEVNGRTGGYIPWLLHRGCGTDLVRLALAAALGTLGEVPTADPTCVPYQYFPAPPAEAKLLAAVGGVDRVRHLPGVERVDVRLAPGSPVDARLGTQCHPLIARGVVADHDELRAVLAAIDRTLVLEYR